MEGRGHPSQRSVTALAVSSFFEGVSLVILEQQLQSSRVKESIEKQYVLYPGTRKKNSLHPINGSHLSWDDYSASVLPCSRANMLRMLPKKAHPFLLLCFKYLAQRFPKWLHWNRCGPNMITYSLKLSLFLAHLCTCLSFSVAPSCTLARSVTCSLSAYSHSVVILLPLCLQCAFWMISWGYQTFLKETLSINIFLILNFTIRGPCLNLCQSEGKLSQNQEMVWEEIELKLFWWKQTLPFGFCYTLWYIIIRMICPMFSLHIFLPVRLH